MHPDVCFVGRIWCCLLFLGIVSVLFWICFGVVGGPRSANCTQWLQNHLTNLHVLWESWRIDMTTQPLVTIFFLSEKCMQINLFPIQLRPHGKCTPPMLTKWICGLGRGVGEGPGGDPNTSGVRLLMKSSCVVCSNFFASRHEWNHLTQLHLHL